MIGLLIVILSKVKVSKKLGILSHRDIIQSVHLTSVSMKFLN